MISVDRLSVVHMFLQRSVIGDQRVQYVNMFQYVVVVCSCIKEPGLTCLCTESLSIFFSNLSHNLEAVKNFIFRILRKHFGGRGNELSPILSSFRLV